MCCYSHVAILRFCNQGDPMCGVSTMMYMRVEHSWAQGLDSKARGVRQVSVSGLSLLVRDGRTPAGRIPGGVPLPSLQSAVESKKRSRCLEYYPWNPFHCCPTTLPFPTHHECLPSLEPCAGAFAWKSTRAENRVIFGTLAHSLQKLQERGCASIT